MGRLAAACIVSNKYLSSYLKFFFVVVIHFLQPLISWLKIGIYTNLCPVVQFPVVLIIQLICGIRSPEVGPAAEVVAAGTDTWWSGSTFPCRLWSCTAWWRSCKASENTPVNQRNGVCSCSIQVDTEEW